MTNAVLSRRLVGVAAAIVAGFGLWRFTSGDWLGGIVLALAVAGVAAWFVRDRRRTRTGRRY